VTLSAPGRESAGGAEGRAVAAALNELLSDDGAAPGTLVSASVALQSAPDLIDLFSVALSAGLEPALWLGPVGGVSMVAIGRAWSVEAEGAERFAGVARAWGRLLAGARATTARGRASGPLLLGGLGFTGEAPEAPADLPWSPFGAASMVLPELLLVRDAEGNWLTASFIATGPSAVAEGLARRWSDLVDQAAAVGAGRADDSDDSDDSPTPLVVAAEEPDRERWNRLVDRFAGAVGRGRLDKIVLARRVELTSESEIDVVAALTYLAANSKSSTTYAFVRSGSVFLGATPEILIATHGSAFETVAIAGTIRHDDDPAAEASLAAELMASDKDREEHEIVVETLRTMLEPVAAELTVAAEPVVSRFGTVQHLVTTVAGRLKDRTGILALAGLLHPTPAVGGEPRDLALELIAEHEGFDRGWYAGPLGWVGADGDGELVVALRCGVVAGKRAWLFAGCGIVADSDASREWEESRNKMQIVAAALGEVVS
jgi:salicylate biosynthesis isochorismate synthase